ncbi:MAG: sodium:solute symporter [Acidobacteriota bacterium]
MNALDYVVLFGVLLGIAGYGIWHTRHKRDLSTYVKGHGTARWMVIGLSVMATQASAITFLSTPGQGYTDGLGFVQNYFGAPFALILISVVFLPMYRRLGIHTVYEFLGQRFDTKTRLFGALLFLVQRGLGAGITVYAPAIVLSTVMGWSLSITIISVSLLVIVYTVSGGSEAVSLTQKYQMTIIMTGMVLAFIILVRKLPDGLGPSEALALAGGFHKLQAVNFSVDLRERYTFWSGLLGGMFLALSYFGADQSQVQRYISGASLRESRMGLMFNAVCKIPMQFGILLLGVFLFVFYQFETPPVFFNTVAWKHQATSAQGPALQKLDSEYQSQHEDIRRSVSEWLRARESGETEVASRALDAAVASRARAEAIRTDVKTLLKQASPGTSTNDSDYVFITFILQQLPHGLIGLLVAAFLAAALQSKAGELSALGATTTVDLYRHMARQDAGDDHHVTATRWFTALWGLVAMCFALFASMSENLIQAVNIVGSIFYGVALGLVLVAFFARRVQGTAVFWAAVGAQLLVFVLFSVLDISYLWYNVIGCAGCVVFSLVLQVLIDATTRPHASV